TLEINLGIVEGALGNDAAAEKHFRRAIELSPNASQPFRYYGRWLKGKSRFDEALQNLATAVAKVPEDFGSRYIQMDIYLQQRDFVKLRNAAADALVLAPGDPR